MFIDEVTDNDRNKLAECMFEARINCQGCDIDRAARFQLQRCNFCRMLCDDDGKRYLEFDELNHKKSANNSH